MTEMMTEEEQKAVSAKLRAWLATPEGKAAMKRAAEQAEVTRKRIEKIQIVSWEDRHRPCTI
jgi:hypothetical protein